MSDKEREEYLDMMEKIQEVALFLVENANDVKINMTFGTYYLCIMTEEQYLDFKEE